MLRTSFAYQRGNPVIAYFTSNDLCLKEALPDHQEAATRLNAPIESKTRHSTPGRDTVVRTPAHRGDLYEHTELSGAPRTTVCAAGVPCALPCYTLRTALSAPIPCVCSLLHSFNATSLRTLSGACRTPVRDLSRVFSVPTGDSQ